MTAAEKDPEKDADLTIDAPLGYSAEGGARPVRAGTLHVGHRFAGRYDIEAELGRGGMGVVYRARDAMLGGELVALKVLFSEAGTPDAIERFRREVRLARRITSPHVARTHDLGEHEGLFYLTMELVEGESLSRRIERSAAGGSGLAPAEALRIAEAIAEGLAAAHAADVVHRDLKPDNVLLAADGRVVVTDFGIARAFRGPEAARATQSVAGTPAYMAPEQLLGGATTEQTDVYALGILLYECLTGALPFGGDSPIALGLARLHQSPEPIDPKLALPAELGELIFALLARQPAARPATAREVAAKLATIGKSLGAQEPALVPPPGQARAPETSSPPAAAATGRPTATRSSVRTDVGLVIMPFEHRGAATDEGVTRQIRDELIDVLSRTQFIRVVGRGFLEGGAATQSDVRSFESRFGARFASEATVQVAPGGARLRCAVRLLEVATGVQTWSENIELEVRDPFVAPERMAYKVAEGLRLALEVASQEGKLPRDVLDGFRRARRVVRNSVIHDPSLVFDELDRAIRDAPGFAPPLALHALACVRVFFAPGDHHQTDWRAEAKRSLERALAEAGHLAETRFAAAAVAWHEVRLRDAVREVRSALAIAPSYPDAIAFMGQLELEAGRSDDGLAHLSLAYDVEPALRVALFERARWHGLYGDRAEFDRLLLEMRREVGDEPIVGQYMVRVGAWRQDDALIREGIRVLTQVQHMIAGPLIGYGMGMLGEATPVQVPPEFLVHASPRLQTIAYQLAAEVQAKTGDLEGAVASMREASEIALADLEWIEKCPFFVSLRQRTEYLDARKRVVARCQEIWAGS